MSGEGKKRSKPLSEEELKVFAPLFDKHRAVLQRDNNSPSQREELSLVRGLIASAVDAVHGGRNTRDVKDIRTKIRNYKPQSIAGVANSGQSNPPAAVCAANILGPSMDTDAPEYYGPGGFLSAADEDDETQSCAEEYRRYLGRCLQMKEEEHKQRIELEKEKHDKTMQLLEAQLSYELWLQEKAKGQHEEGTK